MNKEQHLLACLAEECSEVIKEINKAFRFGLDDFNPKDPNKVTTREKIELELVDLIAVVELLSIHGTIDPLDLEDQRIDAKQRKVSKYMKYARDNGTLVDD